jgi:hypothetical protein
MGVPFNEVKVQPIKESRRYKYMELYWVEDQKIKVSDEINTFTHNGVEVFNIGTEWNVWDWIER